uniref:G-patch domain-containing protein n=1 Tax=Panagrolaimus sp. ES5 TaxID=591445 RepID=A0AC34FCA1_9BILA
MAHFIEPSKRIQFVKGRDEYHSTLEAKKKAKADERKLNGKEIASFYRELVAESSNEKPKEIVNNVNQQKKQHAETVTKSHDQIEPLTERDERLWFKAAATSDLDKCKELLCRGISINLLDTWGSTSLICAAAAGSNIWGSTSLICAAAAGSSEVIEFLMENHADWTIKNRSGFSASELAKRKGFVELAEYIESYGKFNEEQDVQILSASSSSSNFCEHCNQTFINIQAHHCSIVHIVNTSQPPRPGYAYGIPTSNVGYQMLKETGWKEEIGLGKEGEGRKYPLKTMLKRDRKGLGLDKLQSKVTHFEAGDLDAVKALPKLGRRSFFKTMAERKKREKAIEDKVRRAVSDFDEYPL